MKVNINNKEYDLINTMRSIVIFEQITDKAFEAKTTTDILIYFYSVILASNKHTSLTIDELIEAIDKDENLFKQFQEWLTQIAEKNKIFNGDSKKK